MTDIERVITYIRSNQSEKRFTHTSGVANDCTELAKLFEFSPEMSEKLCLAGWLHDITKEMPTEKQKEICDEFTIPVPINGYISPVIHSYTGAYYAKKLFPNIVDDLVFSAIYRHTTGCRGMTLFDMLVCFADYTEPSRKYEGCRRLRQEFYSQATSENRLDLLYGCLIKSFDMTITSLINNGDIIDSDTLDARNYLIEISRIKTLSEVPK